MKNNIRFQIESLIEIARLTDDRVKRESLLNKAYGLLEEVTTVTAREINPVFEYIAENLIHDPLSKTNRTELYANYKKIMVSMGDDVVSNRDFYSALLAYGFEQRTLHGFRYFNCRQLKKDDDSKQEQEIKENNSPSDQSGTDHRRCGGEI